MNKNILMVGYSNFFSDSRIIREAEAAVEGGFSVDVITLFDEKRRKNYKQINVISVNQKKYRGDSKLVYTFAYLEFFLRCFFLVTYLYIIKKYRIIHVNNIPDWIVFATLVPKLFGSKILLDIHDPLSITYSTKFNSSNRIIKKLLNMIEMFSWHFSDRIITVNEVVLKELTIRYKNKSKLKVISNYVDTEKFPYNEDYNLNGKLKLIYHGTIAERFGLDDVLLAINNLKNKEVVHFLIIGTGDYEKILKNKINKYNLDKIVTFDNNAYDVDELNGIIRDYNVGIVPYKNLLSTEFILPLKLQEYISVGLPVITIKSKTIESYYTESELFYYDNKNSASLTKLLERLLTQNELLYEKYKHYGFLRNKYTWNEEKKNYLNILTELMGAR